MTPGLFSGLLRSLRTAFMFCLCFTVLLGMAYPALVTFALQGLFPNKANGSVIMQESRAVGSELLGQSFTQKRYFWSRLSAIEPLYDPGVSAGSNLGAANPALLERAQKRIDALRGDDRKNTAPVPVGLVTSSASGLDPHISPAAAEYQVRRVAKARKMEEREVRALVAQYTEARQFGLFGEPRVNVLKLNLALDQFAPKP